MVRNVRTKLGFPGILALLALFVALGGPSLAEPVRDAARGLVTGKQIKRGSIQIRHLSSKARKALRGKRGLRDRAGADGAAGSTGAAGAAGLQGLQGPAGADAASAFIGGFDFNPSAVNLNIAAASGVSNADVNASEAASDEFSVGGPAVAMVARQLRVDAPVSDGSALFALRVLRADGSTRETLLSCSVSPGTPACDSGGQTGTINPGDLVYMRANGSSTSGGPYARFGWRATVAP